MPTLSAIAAAIDNTAFQQRCRAALLELAGQVFMQVSGYPAQSQAAAEAVDDIQFARAILQEHAQVSDRVLAIYVLGNSDVVASLDPAAINPTTGSVYTEEEVDNAIRWQLNNASWSELLEIG